MRKKLISALQQGARIAMPDPALTIVSRGLESLQRQCQRNGAMSRSRHPNKHIEQAISYAESLGWRVTMSRGHSWGHLLCPRNSRDGCTIRVYSTPRCPEDHAYDLLREIDKCPHIQSTTSHSC